jgi:catechol 2,3-dioxygenase-like lactoylglutathione lyase family enzyme
MWTTWRLRSGFTGVLGLELYSRQVDRHVFLRCGQQMLLLFFPAATLDPTSSLPLHGAKGSGHVAFAARSEDLAGWRGTLARHGVQIEKEVTWPTGGASIYFRDPAGNSLEIASPALWGLPESLPG